VTRYATLIAFGVMVGYFSAKYPHTFPTKANLSSTLQLAAPLVVLAVGLTIVLIGGEFDLSFPSAVNLAGLAAVKIMADSGASPGVAVTVGLAVGVAAGIIAGALVVSDRASSFIVTLALNSVWAGLALGVSGGQYIPKVAAGYPDLSNASILGFPVAVWIALVAVIVAYALMRWTVFGRQVHAVGSSRSAARVSGVRVNWIRLGCFACMGLCAGVAAVLLTASSSAYTPDLGTNLFIPPFVAAFFGISVLAVGRFNIVGTVVGALFIQTLQTGLTFGGVSAWVTGVVTGAVLLTIVMIAGQLRRA
jgi:ribose/xylose/arabinose/galactoside ABC-type transport system permease subunit